MKELYLDANAHVAMNPLALKAYCEFNDSKAGHGHAMSPNAPGRAAAVVIEESRERIANLLGAKPDQIIFTSTCTQACEWAVYLLSKMVENVSYSQAEHPAIRQAVCEYFKKSKDLNINKNGIIELGVESEIRVAVDRYLRNGLYKGGSTDAIVAMYVQNEIGIIQPIEKVDGILLSDFSQAPGKVEFKLSDMNVDLAPFAAHKFGGPPSVGFLYIKDDGVWDEFGTGSRYFLDRAGTPDVGGILATAVALEETYKNYDAINEHMLDFRSALEDGFEELGIEVVGQEGERVNNTTFIKCGKGQGMKIMLELCEDGIYTGLGSACGSAYSGSNPFLKKMGIDGGPHDFMRISTFGEYTSKDASYFLSKFKKYFSKGGD
jgi:cysteine desulfurase